jgi:hypothetical protein
VYCTKCDSLLQHKMTQPALSTVCTTLWPAQSLRQAITLALQQVWVYACLAAHCLGCPAANAMQPSLLHLPGTSLQDLTHAQVVSMSQMWDGYTGYKALAQTPWCWRCFHTSDPMVLTPQPCCRPQSSASQQEGPLTRINPEAAPQAQAATGKQ